ncbi:hypothetical protein SK128_003500 [Halocaridina rubra]|uniref:Sushi domain-containing protein n=1 Tax=Halocaridina rubra TaxID=373956 RepID=A0AAN8X2Y1_HALRR
MTVIGKEPDSAVPLEEQQQRDQHVITAYNIVESPSTVKDILKGRRQKGEMRKNSGESSSSSSSTITTTTTSVDPSTDSKPEEPLRNHRRQERRRGRKDRRRGRKKDRKGRRGERRKGRKERRGRKKKIEGQMTESAAEMDRSVNEVNTGGDGGSRSPTTPQITSSDVGSGSEARRRENKRKRGERRGRGNKNRRRNENENQGRRGRKGQRGSRKNIPDENSSLNEVVTSDDSPPTENQDNQIANEVLPSLHEDGGRKRKRKEGRRRKAKNRGLSSNEVEVQEPSDHAHPLPGAVSTTTETPKTSTTTTTTTDTGYLSTGYPQDSSYSAIEPQYTIEGRDHERTIVDIVPESPSSALFGEEEDNFLKNTFGESETPPETRENPSEASDTKKKKRKKNKKKNKKGSKEETKEESEVDFEVPVDWLEKYNELPEAYPYFSAEEKEGETEAEKGELPEGLPEGYPTNRFHEDRMENGKTRFIEMEDIDFKSLDTSCIISESDSIYLPPPRVRHAHVTAYYTVTNPAPPNNVYVEAVYECKFGYRMDDASSNRVFCRRDKWLGLLPSCVAYGTSSGIEAHLVLILGLIPK